MKSTFPRHARAAAAGAAVPSTRRPTCSDRLACLGSDATTGLARLAAICATALYLAACSSDSSPAPGSAPAPTPAPAASADAIYVNGKVATVDEGFTVAEAFAVKDGRFVAVGSNASVRALADATTAVVDLGGRTVVPGLGDGHLHGPGGGPGMDLSKARSLEDLFAVIRSAAAGATAESVLVSNSDWHEAQLSEQRLPTATELEAAAPGIPVVLVRGGHSYFLNTTALAKWNITPATPIPAGGALPRDGAGNLTGEVTGTAKTLVGLPPPPPVTEADVAAEQRALNAYGLTSVRVPGTTIEAYRRYQAVSQSGQASLRYSVLFRGVPAEALAAAGLRQGDGDDRVRIWGIKMAVDGGFEGGRMSRPYEEPMGAGGTYFGLQPITQTAFDAEAVAWRRAGWRLAVHAVGDAGVDQVLADYEAANADAPIGSAGWTIEHAFITRADQYPRMQALNLRLSVQDHLYLAAPTLARYWGMDRASQVTPLKTYLGLGLIVAGGTDAPVIPTNPFWVLYHFLTRDTISAGVYGADQAVESREALLRLLTIDYARLTDEADIKGSIQPGKLADFVVLSADYLTIAARDVRDIKPVATFVDGRKVYQDPDVPL